MRKVWHLSFFLRKAFVNDVRDQSLFTGGGGGEWTVGGFWLYHNEVTTTFTLSPPPKPFSTLTIPLIYRKLSKAPSLHSTSDENPPTFPHPAINNA